MRASHFRLELHTMERGRHALHPWHGVLAKGNTGFVGAHHDSFDPQRPTHDSQQRAQEETLKQQFSTKAFQAANLEAYKAQMAEMETSFGALLRQLPSDTEVPGLLEDITRTGLGSGLEFEEIKLQPEVAQQFYIELPINIKVVGGYHDLATFVSGVASLPRIVTLHDFEIKTEKNEATSKLRMNIVAKTYRYNDKGLQK